MKERLPVDVVAMRAAKELQDGDVVNLGIGIGTLVSSYMPEDKHVIFHAENGVYGFGHVLTEGEEDLMDHDLLNASFQFVAPMPGMSFGTLVDAFGAARSGRVNKTILGAHQVSEKGDLANFTEDPEAKLMKIGGAMDIASGPSKVIITMLHTTRDGRIKILKKCSLPLTAKECVNIIITDVAFIEVTDKGLILKEVASGWTAEDVQAITEPKLIIDKNLKDMEL